MTMATVLDPALMTGPFAKRYSPAFPTLPDDTWGRYSLQRALQIAAGIESGRGTIEQEVHDAMTGFVAASAKSARPSGAFSIPTRALFAALDSGTATAGQELLFSRPGAVLDVLRSHSVTAALGATILETGLPLSEPLVDGDIATTWADEDGGIDIPDVEPSLDRVDYALKTLGINVPYTRQLLTQTSGARAVDGLVARVAAGAIGAELDRVAIQGSGANGEPLGVLNTTGIGDVEAGAPDGGAPTYTHMVDLEAAVAGPDADLGNLGFAATPGIRKRFRLTEEFPGAGPIWRGGRVLGHRAAVSTNVPADLTKGAGTDLHAVIFGNWAELVIATLPAVDVIVDPFSLKDQGLIEAVYYWHGDVEVRRPQSFAALQDGVV